MLIFKWEFYHYLHTSNKIPHEDTYGKCKQVFLKTDTEIHYLNQSHYKIYIMWILSPHHICIYFFRYSHFKMISVLHFFFLINLPHVQLHDLFRILSEPFYNLFHWWDFFNLSDNLSATSHEKWVILCDVPDRSFKKCSFLWSIKFYIWRSMPYFIRWS